MITIKFRDKSTRMMLQDCYYFVKKKLNFYLSMYLKKILEELWRPFYHIFTTLRFQVLVYAHYTKDRNVI
jgi:hypothetical protein